MRRDYAQTQLQGITDLTVIAKINDGFVEGAFDPCTYVERLRRLLAVLNAVRVNSRESAPYPSPFTDSIGRFNIIHFFRFAIVPPDGDGGPHKLLLNVTFDGGWEPYMRVIWRDLGSLLDIIFCNCTDDGYPLAFESSFESYMAWVRDHEVRANFFYADSALSVSDQRYFEQLEALQRNESDPELADEDATALKLPPRGRAGNQAFQAAERDPLGVALAGVRALKVFFSLDPVYPRNGTRDDDCLVRFVQDVLDEFRTLVGQGLFERLPILKQVGQQVAPLLHRLSVRYALQTVLPRLSFSPAAVQAGILEGYPGVTDGCLVLLRIDDPRVAVPFLEGLGVTTAAAAAGPQPLHYCNVAFTYAGLRALGIPQQRLDRLPQEFKDGMEARAGVLGDVRSNHPEQWHRPSHNWTPGAPGAPGSPSGGTRPVELSTVHVVVQFRSGAGAGQPGDGNTLPPQLLSLVQGLEVRVVDGGAQPSGLKVLSWQAMRRYPAGEVSHDHFGFQDGFSQPRVGAGVHGTVYWRDEVSRGEVFLGYHNDRGDSPGAADDLLDNGSFLVVRKLRQHVDALDAMLERQAQANDLPIGELKDKMMGRRTTGEPLVSVRGPGPNDFNYDADARGAQCPFQSHVRRTNPRDRSPMPRILRRGMSYGPQVNSTSKSEERGVVFMAYSASIAEQFEVLQRWVAGGNGSGVASTQSDPILGVPEPGKARTMRFLHEDRVVRVDLGDRPFVKLEWGVYLFAPSIAALKGLSTLTAVLPVAAKPSPGASKTPNVPTDFAYWQNLLEDPNSRNQGWQIVRDAGGVLDTDYGVLVGSPREVAEVFADDGKRFSVCGYGQRMDASIGKNYLGLDPHDGHAVQSPGVNAAIAAYKVADVFAPAHAHALAWLKGELHKAEVLTGRRETTIDILALSEAVLASLCTEWFGLPDGKHMKRGGRTDEPNPPDARCPGHFFSVARFLFAPHPSQMAQDNGMAHGKQILQAVKSFLADSAAKPGHLSVEIREAIEKVAPGDRDLVARTLAGVMLGFPPTTHGNVITLLRAWLGSRKLWDLQVQLLAHSGSGYSRAQAVLEGPMRETLKVAGSIPEMLWRTAVHGSQRIGGVAVPKGKPVVVGLASAVQGGGDPHLMFGGRYANGHGDGNSTGTHACPGQGMAWGTLLGMVCALLEAGTLRPTSSSVAVTLVD